jgi:VanZ family protein
VPARHYRGLLAIVVVLIAYGSLYPFRFVAVPHYGGFLAIPPGRPGVADVALNVFLYAPVGFLVFHSLRIRRSGLRVALAAFAGTLMSATIEILQGFDVTRDASLSDILSNGTGTLLGALFASAVPRFISSRGLSRLRGVALQPAFLASLWALFQLYPLLPEISHARLARSAAAFTHWSSLDALLFGADWVTALVLLREALPASRRGLAPLLVLLMPVKLILFQRHLTSSELAGALAALVIFAFFARWRSFASPVLPMLLMALLVARELLPFHFGPPARFIWMPFGASLSSQDSNALLVLFRKAFIYGSAIWFVQKARGGVWSVTVSISFLLLVLEWIQRWIPGRTPEITDALMALLIGALLALSSGEGREAVTDGAGTKHHSIR